MPENWCLIYFCEVTLIQAYLLSGEARATLVDYTKTTELNTLLAATVLTTSVIRDMKFSRMLTDSRNSQNYIT